MSTPTATRRPVMGRPGGGGGFPGMQGPVSKADDFKTSAKRLMARMRPQRVSLVLVVVLGVISVGFSVAGPKILGHATDIIFDGIIVTPDGSVAHTVHREGARADAVALGADAGAELVARGGPNFFAGG